LAQEKHFVQDTGIFSWNLSSNVEECTSVKLLTTAARNSGRVPTLRKSFYSNTERIYSLYPNKNTDMSLPQDIPF